MPIELQKSDLNDKRYKYSWTAVNRDSKATRKPDSLKLNRKEGYEVLEFINKFIKDANLNSKYDGLKAERLIKEHMPSWSTESYDDARTWLISNWHNTKYNN